MQSEEIRKRFLEFFEKRDHKVIPSSSLVPENDSSVLFTTAGMQPLVPYLLGQNHPEGKRLVNVQKCVRTQDIEEVGDKTHDTFFEMLGNWSLGDYFKKEAIEWSYEFLTSKDEGLGLDPSRLYITCFEGDDDAPKDEESAKIWEAIGVPKNRIYFLDKKSNWWSPGDNGPSGPDTEMFYDVTEGGLGDLTHEEFLVADEKQEIIEIWNDVFMEYEKKDGKVVGKLKQRNVDTGAGLERLAMVMQKKDNIFDTDLLAPIVAQLKNKNVKSKDTNQNVKEKEIKALRIVADHLRTAVFMISDGVLPSNTDRGYILRRIVRRMVRYADILEIEVGLEKNVATVARIYQNPYPEIALHEMEIKNVIKEEETKFRQTLEKGLKEFNKITEKNITGEKAFYLYQTYGFPVEMIRELGSEKGIHVDEEGFKEEFKKHQGVSRVGAEKKFKGGLANTNEKTIHYHTATHLLHQALRDVLGDHVLQKGSNITEERLRFDFNFERKMTDEEKKKVEDIVNEKIADAIPVAHEDIDLEEAKKRGAIGLFEEKYGDLVRVYSIGEYSLEFCGGPHVTNTSELKGVFKIKKEEAIAQGVRRIKAVLE